MGFTTRASLYNKKINVAHFRCDEDGAVVNYLVTCIKNSYLKNILKEQKQCVCVLLSTSSDESGQMVNPIENILQASASDIYPQIEADFMYSILTKREAWIIIMNVIEEMPITQIAHSFGVSLSAISQSKASGLKKLKQYIIEKMNCNEYEE